MPSDGLADVSADWALSSWWCACIQTRGRTSPRDDDVASRIRDDVPLARPRREHVAPADGDSRYERQKSVTVCHRGHVSVRTVVWIRHYNRQLHSSLGPVRIYEGLKNVPMTRDIHSNSVCPSVCLSRSGIVSKQLNIIMQHTFFSICSPIILTFTVLNTFAIDGIPIRGRRIQVGYTNVASTTTPS